MLRLFRNYLCVATILQLGTSVQAQQPVSNAKPTTKPATAAQPSANKAKAANTAAPAVISKTAAAKTAEAKATEAKTAEAKTAEAKATEAKTTEAKTASVKATKTSDAKAIKTSVAKASKSGEAKSGKANEVKTDTKVVKRNSMPRPALVPPPPPDTPTVFATGVFPGFGGMTDYTNPAMIAGRRKDLVSQLASAKKVLADKEQRTKDLKEKAVQFEQLFSEGVISRRELETAQKEAASAGTELSDAKTQSMALENAVSRLDTHYKPKSAAVNSKKKVKATTAKSTVKVAGTSQKNAQDAVSVARASASKEPSNKPSQVKTNSNNSDSATASGAGKSASAPGVGKSASAPGAGKSASAPGVGTSATAPGALIDSIPNVDLNSSGSPATSPSPAAQTKAAVQSNAKP